MQNRFTAGSPVPCVSQCDPGKQCLFASSEECSCWCRFSCAQYLISRFHISWIICAILKVADLLSHQLLKQRLQINKQTSSSQLTGSWVWPILRRPICVLCATGKITGDRTAVSGLTDDDCTVTGLWRQQDYHKLSLVTNCPKPDTHSHLNQDDALVSLTAGDVIYIRDFWDWCTMQDRLGTFLKWAQTVRAKHTLCTKSYLLEQEEQDRGQHKDKKKNEWQYKKISLILLINTNIKRLT